MADGDVGSNITNDKANLSDAEKRRLRRRQRILENPDARLQRILMNDPSGLKSGGKVVMLKL